MYLVTFVCRTLCADYCSPKPANRHDGVCSTRASKLLQLVWGGNNTAYVVRSHCTTEQLENHFLDVVGLWERLRKELDQESITGEKNGEMFFIEGS